jgi:hypothetical protein
MKLGVVILPAMVWDTVEGFVAGRTGGTDKTKTDGFGPNQPGPSGLRLAGARFVGLLGRSPASTFTTLLPDRLARRQTELTAPNFISL